MAMTKDGAIKILDTIIKTAKDASIVGQLADGVHALIKAYNRIYNLSIQNGWIEDDGIVELCDVDEIPPDTEWIEHLGACAILLREMIILENEI